MKKLNLIGSVAAAVMVFGVEISYAQGSDADIAASPSVGTAPSAKAVRSANRLLAKEVRRTLVQVRGMDSDKIVVFASGGVVTLGGSVPESGQIATAISAAKGVRGVNAVKNSLTVKAIGQ